MKETELRLNSAFLKKTRNMKTIEKQNENSRETCLIPKSKQTRDLVKQWWS